MDSSRPPVPAEIKRQLRQESAFGCAKCGYPIFDYHHIIPWAIEEHFRPEDMVILCPNHHREADLMPEVEQRTYKTNPYNVAHGYVEGQLKITQKELAIKAGPIEFVSEGNLICVNDEPIITLSANLKGTLNVSLRLFDENDTLCLLIEDNEWIYGDIKVWDIQFKHNKLSILKKSRNIAIVIDASAKFVSLKGTFWRNKKKIVITDSEFLIYDTLMNVDPVGGFKDICLVSLLINLMMNDKGLFEIKPAKSGVDGGFVSDPDKEIRLQKGIDFLVDLKKRNA